MAVLTSPKAVLFDWDNTLVNTWPIIHSALHNTFVDMGHEPWTLETTKKNVRKSMRDAFPEIFGEQWEQAGSIYQRYYQATHLERLEALPQAEDVLKWVREQGLFSAVVSNKKGYNLRKELAHLGWDHYFDAVVGSDDAARDKPDPAPVILALVSANLSPGPQIWFVGDSIIDLECAQNTGCVPVLYGEVDIPDAAADGGEYLGFHYVHHSRDHSGLLKFFELHRAENSA